MKFAHFKDKESLLSSSGKLKGTDYGISEDFPPEIRFARRRLIEFGKAQRSQYKLRYDKLISGRKTYVYDPAEQLVVERQAYSNERKSHEGRIRVLSMISRCFTLTFAA